MVPSITGAKIGDWQPTGIKAPGIHPADRFESSQVTYVSLWTGMYHYDQSM